LSKRTFQSNTKTLNELEPPVFNSKFPVAPNFDTDNYKGKKKKKRRNSLEIISVLKSDLIDSIIEKLN